MPPSSCQNAKLTRTLIHLQGVLEGLHPLVETRATALPFGLSGADSDKTLTARGICESQRDGAVSPSCSPVHARVQAHTIGKFNDRQDLSRGGGVHVERRL